MLLTRRLFLLEGLGIVVVLAAYDRPRGAKRVTQEQNCSPYPIWEGKLSHSALPYWLTEKALKEMVERGAILRAQLGFD